MGVVAEASPYSREAPVVVERGETMQQALGRALDGAGLAEAIAARSAELETQPADLRIAIKANLMTGAGAEAPPATSTDPATLDALVTAFRHVGCSRIAVVESPISDVPERSVAAVAEGLGFVPSAYELVDLSAEQEAFDYGGTLGADFAGTTWRDADFRVSLAQCKTSALLVLSGAVANVFGTLPRTDKRAYAKQGRSAWEACRSALDAFPVDFGVVDAWRSRDGSGWDASSGSVRDTRTMLASPNVFALDWVTGEMMGADPALSPLLREGVLRWGRVTISRRGNLMGWDPFAVPGPAVVAAAGMLSTGPLSRVTEGRCGWTVQ
jgi:uncharacterized protein (DUF362 family)